MRRRPSESAESVVVARSTGHPEPRPWRRRAASRRSERGLRSGAACAATAARWIEREAASRWRPEGRVAALQRQRPGFPPRRPAIVQWPPHHNYTSPRFSLLRPVGTRASAPAGPTGSLPHQRWLQATCQICIGPARFIFDPNMQAERKARDLEPRLNRIFDSIDAQIDGHPYLLGGSCSAADLYCFMPPPAGAGTCRGRRGPCAWLRRALGAPGGAAERRRDPGGAEIEGSASTSSLTLRIPRTSCRKDRPAGVF